MCDVWRIFEVTVLAAFLAPPPLLVCCHSSSPSLIFSSLPISSSSHSSSQLFILEMFTSIPDRPKLWAPPLAAADDDSDSINIVLDDFDDWDDWPLDSNDKDKDSLPRSGSVSPAFHLPSLVPASSQPRPVVQLSASLTTSISTIRPATTRGATTATQTASNITRQNNQRPTHPLVQPVQSTFPTSAVDHSLSNPAPTDPPRQTQHLVALYTSGVRHVPALEVRDQWGLLGGTYVESMVYGDRVVLLAGEAALSSVSLQPARA